MRTVDAELLKRGSIFNLKFRRWGNSRKVKDSQVAVEEESSEVVLGNSSSRKSKSRRVRASKKLLVSPEYDAIVQRMAYVSKWCKARSVPSFFRNGLYIVGYENIEAFENFLTDQSRVMREELLPPFVEAYNGRKEEARKPAEAGGLGPLYDESDYPGIPQLVASFELVWNWITLGVPDYLPEDVARREVEKLQAKFKEAEGLILLALREEFMGLVEHATERLTAKPGEKPKRLYESVLGNLQAFIDTFKMKNLLDDSALAEVVDQAKRILIENRLDSPDGTDKLREGEDLRSNVAEQFDKVKETVSAMVTEAKSRAFAFDEE